MAKPILSNSSLSSVMRLVKCIPEFKGDELYLSMGEEIHAQILEDKTVHTFDDPILTRVVSETVSAAKFDPRLKSLMKGARCEAYLNGTIQGFKFRGMADIIHYQKKYLVDLKTTSVRSNTEFTTSAIKYGYFRQAAIYMTLAKMKNFYYAGLCKKEPYNVYWIDVKDHPVALRNAYHEIDFLIYLLKAYPDLLERVIHNSRYNQSGNV